MKILIATLGMHFPWVDGRITALRTLAESWVDNGAKVQVLTTGPATIGREVLTQENGISYRLFPGGSKKNWWRLVCAFSCCCRRGEWDLVVYRPFAGFNTINIIAIMAFRLICAVRRVPFVLSMWGGPAEMLKVPWLFSGTILVGGESSRGPKTVTIPPLVEIRHGDTPVKNRVPLKRWGVEDKDRVFLFTYCGRADSEALWHYIMRRRGLGDLIDAAVCLKGTPNLKIVVSMPMLARDNAQNVLNNVLEQKGVRDMFVLTHEIDDLEQVLMAVDCYVYPVDLDEISWAPLSILEAFACGTPVISTRTPAILRFASDNEALLYEPGRIGELAHLILRLHREEDLAASLRREGMKKAEVYNTKGKAAGETLRALTSLFSH